MSKEADDTAKCEAIREDPLPAPQDVPRHEGEKTKDNKRGLASAEQRSLSGGAPLVVWKDGDPECPKNWPRRRKWMMTTTVSLYCLLAPLTSTIIAPAEDQISTQFGITSSVLRQMETTLFVLAFAFGPLLFGPLSELYGRRIVLIGGNAFYLVFNLVCAWAPDSSGFFAFRFLAGVGGSAPIAVGGGTVGDIWRPEERGRAMATYALMPLLGPSFGPIIGAWIAEKSTWRWCFWSTSILGAVIQACGLRFLRETYEPTLLERKAKALRAARPDLDPRTIRTPHTTDDRGFRYIITKGLSWPFRILIHEPIVQWISAIQAINYGLIYLVLTEVPPVYQGIYGESLGIAGLHYIATAIGFILVAQVQGYVSDPMYRHLVAKYGKGRPEFRVPPLYIGAWLLPVGFLIFGWTAEKRVQWLVPDIGLALISGGMVSANQTTQTYIIDSYTLRAASALSVMFFIRALAGFALPLAAPSLFSSLSLGGGCSLLAGLSILFAVPAGPVLWHYGPRLRQASRYAKKDEVAPV